MSDSQSPSTRCDDIGDRTESLVHRQLMAYALDLSRTYKELRKTQAKLEELYVSTLAALAAAIEARDPYLVGHSRTVALLASTVGQEMGLSPEQMQSLWRAALLHDIGKIGVPDSVLKKPGRLNETELQEMREHPQLGYEMLSSLSFLGEALLAIRHHHERYDGRGYPAGLAGEDIPLLARILSVCDALDAMTSNRAYRPPMAPKRAIRELLAGRGSQFDPQVADLLILIVRRKGWGLA